MSKVKVFVDDSKKKTREKVVKAEIEGIGNPAEFVTAGKKGKLAQTNVVKVEIEGIGNPTEFVTAIKKRKLAKTDVAKVSSMKRRKVANDLIASMDLDEMLEASKVIEMGLRGEKIPTVMSSKVRRYVRKVLILNKNDSTKSIAKKMQQDLTVKIIERNKETTNVAEAKKLYHALMNEQ